MPYDPDTWRTTCDTCGVVCYSDRDPQGPVAVSTHTGGVLCYPCWDASSPHTPAPRQLDLEL